MQITFSPHRPLLIDLETQSGCNLKSRGGRNYAAASDTRLLSVVALDPETNSVYVWAPPPGLQGREPGWADLWPIGWSNLGYRIGWFDAPEIPEPLLQAAREGRTFVAHNAFDFDALVWERLFPEARPAAWFDTLPAARQGGFPGALDKLGERLVGRGKDQGGKGILKQFYGLLDVPPGRLLQILRYNVADVLILRAVYDAVHDYGEPDVIRVHHEINARGIQIDRPLVELLKGFSEAVVHDAEVGAELLTHGALTGDDLRSGPKVKHWLATQGLPLNTIRRNIVDRLAEQPESLEDFHDVLDEAAKVTYGLNPQWDTIVPLLRFRQTATRITGSKLDAALAWAGPGDDRLRDIAAYHAAGTGRFAGRGVQLQNLTKGIGKLDVESLIHHHEVGTLDLGVLTVELERVKMKTHQSGLSLDDVIGTLVRPALVAAPGSVFIKADLSSIEGRGVAWVAGQRDLLDVFRTGGDVYCVMASQIYGRTITPADETERQVGKVTVLGAGYSMSAAKFALYCAAFGINLEAAGTTAARCIGAFRESYRQIAGAVDPKTGYTADGIWQRYNHAAWQAAVHGRPSRTGKCGFFPDRKHLVIELPSGRRITYRNTRVEDRLTPWTTVPKPTLVYESPRGERTLYGGKITENVVQAVSRDLLTTALVRCESVGLRSVMHVHDEIVCEVPVNEAPSRLDQMLRIFTTPPAWASGFPVQAEGFISPRYTKKPFKGYKNVVARDGQIL